MAEAHHPIQLVARLTGLSPYVIRIWEQRYRAVEPARTSTNRRLYSEKDIERLSLLRDLTQAGHSIGQIAQLPDQKLRKLGAGSVPPGGPRPQLVTAEVSDDVILDDCVSAIKSLDVRAFDERLKRASLALGAQGVLQRLIAPLIQTLGELWREGKITAAHEHFATARIRDFLSHLANAFGGSEGAPVLVVATPAGQIHELGALLAGAMAANLGWQVTQLGANLPAAEIAGAAQQKHARAVALSLVYPEDDPRLAGELTLLRELLPTEIALLVGGRGMPAYRQVLVRLGATLVEDLAQFGATLDALRRPAKKSGSKARR